MCASTQSDRVKPRQGRSPHRAGRGVTPRVGRGFLGGLVKDLRAWHRRMYGWVALPEARGGGGLRSRILIDVFLNPFAGGRAGTCARTEWDKLIVGRQPIAEAYDLRLVALYLVTLPGGSIVRFHGVCCDFLGPCLAGRYIRER